MVNNLKNLFNTNIRLNTNGITDAFDADAIWPHGIELTITRVPIRVRDGYSIEMIKELAKKIKTHTVPNGIVFLICYAPTEAKSRPFEIAKAMVDEGFTHIDNIIIERSWMGGKRSEVNLVNSYDMVLHFCNGTVWNLDRLPIKEYMKMGSDKSCCGNLFKVETGSIEEAYPLDLAKLLIQLADLLPGSQLFDCFMGTQAALKAALELGHSFAGFERDMNKLKKYNKLIKEFNDKERK